MRRDRTMTNPEEILNKGYSDATDHNLTIKFKAIVKSNGFDYRTHSIEDDTILACVEFLDRQGMFFWVNKFTTQEDIMNFGANYIEDHIQEPVQILSFGDTVIYAVCDYEVEKQYYLYIGWAWGTPYWPIVSWLTSLCMNHGLFDLLIENAGDAVQMEIAEDNEAALKKDPNWKEVPSNEPPMQPWWNGMIRSLYRPTKVFRISKRTEELLGEKNYQSLQHVWDLCGIVVKEQEKQEDEIPCFRMDYPDEGCVHSVLWDDTDSSQMLMENCQMYSNSLIGETEFMSYVKTIQFKKKKIIETSWHQKRDAQDAARIAAIKFINNIQAKWKNLDQSEKRS